MKSTRAWRVSSDIFSDRSLRAAVSSSSAVECSNALEHKRKRGLHFNHSLGNELSPETYTIKMHCMWRFGSGGLFQTHHLSVTRIPDAYGNHFHQVQPGCCRQHAISFQGAQTSELSACSQLPCCLVPSGFNHSFKAAATSARPFGGLRYRASRRAD